MSNLGMVMIPIAYIVGVASGLLGIIIWFNLTKKKKDSQ